MRLYGDLAPWFHLLTHPDEYAEEADHIVRLAEAACASRPETLLELGAGGGNNASYLKRRFASTLTDISPEMLALSASINPECPHISGDMRNLRLDHAFDVVLAHDAIGYMTSEHDLAAAIATAAAHVAPGGVAIFLPDAVTETLSSGTEHGGRDGADGRGLRYLMWTRDNDPRDALYEVDFALILRERDHSTRFEHEQHVCGLFGQAMWLELIAASGLVPIEAQVADPYPDEHAVFVGRRAV